MKTPRLKVSRKKVTFMDRYWICGDCAEEKDLIPFKTGNTVISGYCGHCKSTIERLLTPTRDFRKGVVKRPC